MGFFIVKICLVWVWLIKFIKVVIVVVFLEFVCFVIKNNFLGCFVIFCKIMGIFNLFVLGILEVKVCI